MFGRLLVLGIGVAAGVIGKKLYDEVKASGVAAGVLCQKVYDEAKTSTKAWWNDLLHQK